MLEFENELIKKGYNLIAGIDEAGRGPLAGPVVAAAVIMPNNLLIEGLTDSKALSKKKREFYYEKIQEFALAIGVSIIDEKTIDKINILNATKLAMKKALKDLDPKADYALIDAVKLDLTIESNSIIKGDAKSQTIAAASIIAKVTRDKIMEELDQKYPQYDFKNNMGYPTKKHLEALKNHGITDVHRRSYKPVKDAS